MSSICTIHGKQEGLSCEECDAKAPKDVLAAREINPSKPSGTDADFDAAVARAVAKQLAGSKKKGKAA